MSLFKVLRGSESNLPTNKTDGWAYFCTDTGSFWIDHLDSNNTLIRSKISAKFADKLRYVEDGATIEINPSEIATKTYVATQLSGKADSSHTHDDRYYTEDEIDTQLKGYVPTTRKVNGKALSADITLSASDVGALPSTTSIPDSLSDLSSDSTHRTVTDTEKATWNAKSNFSGNYNDLTNKPTIPSVDGLATETYVDNVANGKVDKVTGKGLSTNDYTTTDKNKLAGIEAGAQVNTITGVKGNSESTYRTGNVNITKANIGLGNVDNTADANKSVNYATSAGSATKDASGNTITATYETKTDAAAKLTEAKTYADNAALAVKNDLLNGAGAAYDTLKELGDLIDDNKDAIDALEDIAAGKADKTHSHAISDVTGLQSALDGKAASSHGTHVTYSTTAPVMDGTASVGSASTVARSDHKHPTDTSRAAKDDLDTHTANTTIHITSTERSNWNVAKTHADSAHAPSNAEKNQNAFSNVVVGSTTIAADNATDSLTIAAGTGISVEADATNDKVTITNSGVRSIATGTTNGTISVNTNGASAEVAVKGLGSAAYTASTAYDAAGTATAKASTALGMAKEYTDQVAEGLQANIDGKASTSHNHTVANITDLTATATELNYMDGVTSNVQTQLDGKSASGHKHAATDITSGTLSSDRLPTVPIAKGGTGATTAAAALTNLGITATAAELNKLDGITTSTTELNYVKGVTSSIQTQLNGKAASGHTHDNLVCSTIDITNGASKNRESGFVKLNNGMILQWGTVQNVANETTTAVNFPIAFPNYVGGTVMLTGNYSGSYGYELHANNVGQTGFSIIKKGGSTTSGKDAVSWLVVGW